MFDSTDEVLLRRGDLERVLTTIDGGGDLADVQDARQVLAALRQ